MEQVISITRMMPITFTPTRGVEEKAIDSAKIWKALQSAVQKRLDDCYAQLLFAKSQNKITAVNDTYGILFVDIQGWSHTFNFKSEEAMQDFIHLELPPDTDLFNALKALDKLTLMQIIKALVYPEYRDIREVIWSMCFELLTKEREF
jgi:hypothetical protein